MFTKLRKTKKLITDKYFNILKHRIKNIYNYEDYENLFFLYRDFDIFNTKSSNDAVAGYKRNQSIRKRLFEVFLKKNRTRLDLFLDLKKKKLFKRFFRRNIKYANKFKRDVFGLIFGRKALGSLHSILKRKREKRKRKKRELERETKLRFRRIQMDNLNPVRFIPKKFAILKHTVWRWSNPLHDRGFKKKKSQKWKKIHNMLRRVRQEKYKNTTIKDKLDKPEYSMDYIDLFKGEYAIMDENDRLLRHKKWWEGRKLRKIFISRRPTRKFFKGIKKFFGKRRGGNLGLFYRYLKPYKKFGVFFRLLKNRSRKSYLFIRRKLKRRIKKLFLLSKYIKLPNKKSFYRLKKFKFRLSLLKYYKKMIHLSFGSGGKNTNLCKKIFYRNLRKIYIKRLRKVIKLNRKFKRKLKKLILAIKRKQKKYKKRISYRSHFVFMKKFGYTRKAKNRRFLRSFLKKIFLFPGKRFYFQRRSYKYRRIRRKLRRLRRRLPKHLRKKKNMILIRRERKLRRLKRDFVIKEVISRRSKRRRIIKVRRKVKRNIYRNVSRNRESYEYAKKFFFYHTRILRHYYDIHSPRKFWKISRKFRAKLSNLSFKKYFFFFECRLDSLIYKLGLSGGVEESRDIILKKRIMVNGRITNCFNYVVKIGDVFGIVPKYRRYYRRLILAKISRLRTNFLSFSKCTYIESNFKLMVFGLINYKFSESFLKLPFKARKSIVFGLGKRNL